MNARARMHRWEEELRLIPEEIRRSIEYFEWHAKWWEDRATMRTEVSGELREGLAAYAARQAKFRRGLAVRGAQLWKKARKRDGKNSHDTGDETGATARDKAADDGDDGDDGDDAADDKSEDDDEKSEDDGEDNEEDDEEGVEEIEQPEDVVAYLELNDDDYM